jgi:signal transduction histidine kinase/ActR/RegA family two-component response regulator
MKKVESSHLPEILGEHASLRSTAELWRELRHERRAYRRAAQEAERYRRYAQALDRLCAAAFAADGLDNLLQKLVDLFVEVSGAEVGVLRLREGDRLWSRAAEGVDSKGIRAHHSLNLVEGENLVGVITLGTLEDRQLSDEERRLFAALASHAAAAIRRAQAQEALRAAVSARDEVLSVVAHDLKNPLNVISIAATTMLKRTEESSARRPIERILRGVERADRMLRGLLEINAIEAGRLSLEKGPLEPADLILSALESQQGLAADASVIIASDLAPELPAIEGDEERLLEVFENLIGNAVKFTSSGDSVIVGASRKEGEILFWIKDSGSGILPEELPHVFDRFWHAKRAKRRGTGLGLTICKGIVEAHGGRMWLESAPGQGTTAFFTIPIAAATSSRSEAIEVVNILLVDDRPENLLSLKAILERPDYRLVSATSGQEALALALRERFALALIDVAMPGMNGLEVAVHLKELERSRGIPIIFVTAFGNDPQEIHRAYAAGGADYLIKPLDPDIVRKKVAVFVDLSRRRFGNHAGIPQN